jgi:hypothetical protein
MSTPPVSANTVQQRQTLFNLLPALYRLRDAQLAASAGIEMGPLQSLLSVVEEQISILEENMNQLYDDQFIETCAPWVVPYIGDLIGYQSIHGIASSVDSPRAEVASTIGFRRRKGTVPVLEQLARDVTGWGAHAVEFFQVLATTQCIRNHTRPHNFYAPDLRRWQPREYIDTGFDKTAHKADVRRIVVEHGRYNVQNIGIFLWSLNAYSLTQTPLTQLSGSPQCFRFSSLGADAPLFNNPTELAPETTTLAVPQNVPNYLSRHVLCKDITQIQQNSASPVYYGPGLSLAVYRNGSLQDPARIQVTNLSGADGSWINIPASGNTIAVDPELGRVAIAPGTPNDKLSATWYYGFNAPIGGGEYPRAASFLASPEQAIVRVPGDYATIHEALAALSGDGVVEISDSAIYSEPSGLNVSVRANGHIELRAADESRPTLLLGGQISITGASSNGIVESAFDINGLLIAYEPASGATTPSALIHVPATNNALASLNITHCTVVPGWALQPDDEPQTAYAGLPLLLVEASGVAVQINQSILGPLWLNGQSTASLTDSILDATDPTLVACIAGMDSTTKRPIPSGAMTMQGCTVIGKVYASLLSLVSDCIFWAELTEADVSNTPPVWNASLWAARQQQGCVRFSFVPAGAVLPRNYECVEQAPGGPAPMFYSLRYGHPAYAKLLPTTDPAIRQGADDAGEMGAFHFLLAPLREADLRIRLQEYMPVGLEFGIFYES